MQGYSKNGESATEGSRERKARQARERRAKRNWRKEAVVILRGLNALAVEDAIDRAPCKEKDEAGKSRRIGANVGKLCRQLLYWEGRGQDGEWIHKTRREWLSSEVPLTEAKLRTARRVAREEGLIEEKQGFRPSDGSPTVFYRLNAWEVARVVIRSELEHTRELLRCERRAGQREALRNKVRKLEQAKADLDLVDEPGRDRNCERPVLT